MSMFKVFGVTAGVAQNKAIKKFESLPSEEKKKYTQEQYEEWIVTEANAFFRKMTPVAIGKGFDAPQFADELIDLCSKTTMCRDLHVRINVAKTDKKGGIVLNKKTKQPTLTWEKYDPDKDYHEALRKAQSIKVAA